MTNQLTIAVDSGKHSTKSASYINSTLQKVRFRTKVKQDVGDLGVEIAPNNYLVEIEGTSYLVGDMLGENQTNFDISKHSTAHLVCIYLSITKFIEKAGLINVGIPTIRLAVNVPLSLYKNNQLKTEFERFILNNQKPVSLRVNGKAFIFRIQSVLLLPEGLGTIYAKTTDYRNKRITVFDIGSLNVNFCEFQSLVPKLDSMFISNQGVNILRSKMAEELTTRYGISISAEDAEQILKDKYLYLNGVKQEDSKTFIEKLIATHIDEISNFAKSKGLTFNNTSLLFCGGGSILFKEAILREFPTAILDTEGIYANLISYLKVLEAKGLVSA